MCEKSVNFPQKPENFPPNLKNLQLGAQKCCMFFKNIQKKFGKKHCFVLRTSVIN